MMANSITPESILLTIKSMLGVEPDYEAFDTSIIVNINMALMSLSQLGIGRDEGFTLTTGTETWSEFLEGEAEAYPACKTFVYLTVMLAFDPPPTSFALDSAKRQLDELAWRLNAQFESPPSK